MKIGITTFWESNDNYGQILQSFALQKFLQNHGHDAFVIRYKKPSIPLSFSKKKKYWNMMKKLLKIYPLFIYLYNKYQDKYIYKTFNKTIDVQKTEQLRDFETFRNQNIKYSSLIYDSTEQLKQNSSEVDCLITGSDQVWHHSFLCKAGAPFFLDFGNEETIRLSYAPSFGVKYVPNDKMSLLAKHLNRFNAISVREISGKNICEVLGFETPIVVDPTMLLPKDEYINLLSSSDKEKSFAYLYILNIKSPTDISWAKIDAYLKKRNLKSVVTNASGGFPAKEWFPDVDYQYSTIPQWISNIKNSEIFLTTSFHGVVFAILMHANFVFVPIKTKGANSRAESLLNSLNLSFRIWDCKKDLDKLFEQEIDWNKIDNNLNQMRQFSVSWLLSNISKKA